jgi:hypothetical protein
MAAFVLMVPVALYAQHAHFAAAGQNAGKTAPAAPKKSDAAPAKAAMTDAQKIANAQSAAPASISSKATIMDWGESETSKPRQLRAGTNGWVCYPSTPENTGGEDPMCLDKGWQAWGEAFMGKKPQPPAGTAGIAYMLKGDKGTSNIDPNATGPTATNQWVVSPAHVMVLYADPKMLDAYTTDPKSGGPWVMWKGSPYAHLMVPVSPTKGAAMAAMSGATKKK